MGLLNPPLDWTPDSTLNKLLNNFVLVYQDPPSARNLVAKLGIEYAALFPVGLVNMELIWKDMFRLLADREKLRKLVEIAKADPATAADVHQSLLHQVLEEDSQDKPKGLTFEERQNIKAAFSQEFSTPAKFRELVETGLNLDPDQFLSGVDLEKAINALIEFCEENGRVTDLFDAPFKLPALANDLLLKLAIAGAREAYDERMGKVPLEDPFEACFMNQDIPFIDRRGIRKSAQELVKEDGKRLLVVNGESGVGKTHSQYFIELIGKHYGFKYCFIELEQEGPGSFKPDDFALRVDSDLILPAHPDQPIIPEEPTDPGKWATKISNWLIKKLNLYDTHCWIALDGFSHEDLPEPTKELVVKLVNAVQGSRLPKVRLILLDYPPNKVKQVPLFEREDIKVVGKEDFEAYLIKAIQQLSLQIEDVKVRKKAQEIIDGLSDKPEQHMSEIMFRVIDVPKELSQG